MYRCNDCNLCFDQPKRYIDRHGLDCPPYEHHMGCPSCGGDDYDVLKEDEE